jgi:hypothetical protein
VTDGPQGSSLTHLEIASGLVFGVEATALAGDRRDPRSSTRAALEAAVLPALRRPPCVVSFSGGLDSSVVLAIASSVARREGLPLPFALTLRFPGIAEADESSWQEAVLAVVPVGDWERVELHDELSVVGPVAADVLRRHGLLWPFNAYVHVPVFDRARGGAVLTGVGGDELFVRSRWERLAAIAAREAHPKLRDLPLVALALTPRPLRAMALERRSPPDLPWLSVQARKQLAYSWAAEAGAEPRSASRRASWRLRLRSLRMVTRSLGALAVDRDVEVLHPLANPAVAIALARDRATVDAGRGERLRAIVGDLLPAQLFERRTKASFNAAFWDDGARRLAGDWSGQGVDPELVVVDRVREAWLADVPDGRTFTLLQSFWLDRRRAAEASRAAPPSSPGARPRTADAEGGSRGASTA